MSRRHILVIDAPYYSEISASLMEGVLQALEEEGATHSYVSVPGVLEIPTALAMALEGSKHYDGYVLIGCVIRGETTHYDIVANESARAIMELSVRHRLALGNGIQTVENEAQAWARAKVAEKNKGGGAARAALEMIALREKLS
ncbi:MAG: 6,7-dimethyl-8-ribityllumazine synthase [Rhizobiaceae bacterium]|jgi:6,7-dimethyl-8-ribityllumazine synthase|nr:6,7-dimethyl-8-ribityllumazine synthase [Rhizobiaceae bacterium]